MSVLRLFIGKDLRFRFRDHFGKLFRHIAFLSVLSESFARLHFQPREEWLIGLTPFLANPAILSSNLLDQALTWNVCTN